MKNSTIALAALAAISSAHYASAQTTIVVTGSSAFRGAASNAILNVFRASGNSLTGYAYSGTSFTGATYQIFKGNISGFGAGNPVTVLTDWTGSAGGINAVSNAVPVAVLPTSQTITSSGTSSAVLGSDVANADICFADNLQASTNFTDNTIVQTKVGIIPFAFVASANAPFTNITHQLVKTLLTRGRLPASDFTGNSANTNLVILGGRNDDSGTRITTLAETGYGTTNTVVQFEPKTFGSGATANKISTIGFTADGGNGGESSGGTLANYVRYDVSSVTAGSPLNITSQPITFVAYVGENDSYTAVYGTNTTGSSFGTPKLGSGAANGIYLTYNGVSAFGGNPFRANAAAGGIVLGSPTITLPSVPTGVLAGQIVNGAGIAGGSVVVSTTGTTVTLDKNATITNTAPVAVQVGALLPAAIRSGNYPFWNYEYMGHLGLTGNKLTYFTTLVAQVKNVDFGFSGLADDTAQKVFRTDDGGILLPQN